MTRLESVYDESVKFQLTSSRRGWRRKSKGYIDIRVISTHILTKRMTILYIWSDMNKIFQLTSSRRGWLLSNHPHRFLEYFNSHPHEEDDSIRRLFGLYTNISTHILTKRMTFWGTHDICRYHISTHILTKRMTDLYDHLHHLLEFQLTSSRRGWPKQILLDGSAELISTHILTKRMTVFCPSCGKLVQAFQLTSSRRGWQQF